MNGEWHRINGPAIEWTCGTKKWFLNDKHHRTDGPAIEYEDGYKKWWLNDNFYSKEEWKKEIEKLNQENKS